MNDHHVETRESFSRVAELYNEVFFRADEEAVTRMFFPNDGSVLIVGCGAGRTVIPMIQKGFKVSAFDISSQMVELAKKQLVEHGLSADIRCLDALFLKQEYEGQKFDVIFFPFHALDYIFPLENRISVLLQAKALLNEGGKIIFSTHNRFFPRSLKQFIHFHENEYTYLRSKEGDLFTFTSDPWRDARQLRNHFARVQFFHRYSFIPMGKEAALKERLARLTAPLLDKSFYFVLSS